MRNPSTKVSKAITRAPATKKVAISGTPIQNTPEDVFAPLRFIGHPAGANLAEFKKVGIVHSHNLPRKSRRLTCPGKSIAKPAMAGGFGPLHEVQRQCLLQRSKYTRVDGRPVLDLAPKRNITHSVKLNEAETQIYYEIRGSALEAYKK